MATPNIPTSFTIEDIQNIESVIASGMTEVRLQNGEVLRANSVSDLILIIDYMKRTMINALGASPSTVGAIVPVFRSGIHGGWRC